MAYRRHEPKGVISFLCRIGGLYAASLWLLFSLVLFIRTFFLSSSSIKSIKETFALYGNQPTDVTVRLLKDSDSNHLHGHLGFRSNGTRAWTPAILTPSSTTMAGILREGGGFNLRLSNSLPLDRTPIDRRPSECRMITYDEGLLPSASIIIVFYNEPFSTLMRSVHSVLNLTPPKLLHELILVDDGSDLNWIISRGTGQLQEYVDILNQATNVKLVRLAVRKGIVPARMAGIRAAEGEIFVILDSHIEVQPKWLEPLVQRIQQNPSTILMPSVDSINPEDLSYESGGIGCLIGFLWKLMEHGFNHDERSPPNRQNANPTEFIDSPTMAGGLFVANTEYFLNIGGYDELFSYWGTENLYLSFKVWMCGGRIECSPCSRVYHIFRKGGTGYVSPPTAITKNKMRLLIWMDEYADLAWRVIGSPKMNIGSYSKEKEFKDKHCLSFRWYLENVNPESDVQVIPQDVPYLGAVRNVGRDLCLDTFGDDYPGHRIQVFICNGGRSQDFMYFALPQHIMPVLNDESCLAHDDMTEWCQRGSQEWEIETVHNVDKSNTPYRRIKHLSTGNCLGVSTDEMTLVYMSCDHTSQDKLQLWSWPDYNPPKIFTPTFAPAFRGNREEKREEERVEEDDTL